MNELVNAREAAIRLFLGAQVGETLNSAPYRRSVASGSEIAAQLKQAVNQFQAEAFADDGSQVDYSRLQQSTAYHTFRSELTPQLQHLDLATLADRETQLAFWINLYNALVIDAVISYGVQRSVSERMAGLAFFRCAAYNIGGQRFSAEDIEHGILRANRGNPAIFGPQFASTDPRHQWSIATFEPRIHFALNCASRSCPPIGVYAAEQIDAQLDIATRNFVSADIAIEPHKQTVRLSQIYNWYSDDFGGVAGVLRFVRSYLPPDDERSVWINQQRELDFVYRRYDWGLNV